MMFMLDTLLRANRRQHPTKEGEEELGLHVHADRRHNIHQLIADGASFLAFMDESDAVQCDKLASFIEFGYTGDVMNGEPMALSLSTRHPLEFAIIAAGADDPDEDRRYYNVYSDDMDMCSTLDLSDAAREARLKTPILEATVGVGVAKRCRVMLATTVAELHREDVGYMAAVGLRMVGDQAHLVMQDLNPHRFVEGQHWFNCEPTNDQVLVFGVVTGHHCKTHDEFEVQFHNWGDFKNMVGIGEDSKSDRVRRMLSSLLGLGGGEVVAEGFSRVSRPDVDFGLH